LAFLFGDMVFDAERRELRSQGTLIAIEPQVFDLLEYLIRNRDCVVSRDDLLSAVWGGRMVSDSAIAARINAARRAVGDSGEQQRWIRTVARKDSVSLAMSVKKRHWGRRVHQLRQPPGGARIMSREGKRSRFVGPKMGSISLWPVPARVCPS
jgi:protein gp37